MKKKKAKHDNSATRKRCPSCGWPSLQEDGFCKRCGAPLAAAVSPPKRWEQKRAQIINDRRVEHRTRLTLRLMTGGAVALVVLLVYLNLPRTGNPIVRDQPVVIPEVQYNTPLLDMTDVGVNVSAGQISLSLPLLKEKKLVSFSQGAGEGAIPLLAYISPEGRVVTAVSMCEPCNSRRFHVQGDALVCNTCGTRWDLNTLAAIAGSCGKYPPDAVPNTLVKGTVRIDARYVEGWQQRI